MKTKIFVFVLLAFITVIFCFCSEWLPDIGNPESAPNTHVSTYYIEHSREDTGAANIVSGTLADYRGFDTMFETSVMFVSGLVVTLLLVRNDRKEKKEK